MTFLSKEHKLNYLLKQNRENLTRINSLWSEIQSNFLEINRLLNEAKNMNGGSEWKK